MASIDSTVIPEKLGEELLIAVIEDGETHVSKLGKPKLVNMTALYPDVTVIPTASISDRTITFGLEDPAQIDVNGGSTILPSAAHGSPVGYAVLIKGRI